MMCTLNRLNHIHRIAMWPHPHLIDIENLKVFSLKFELRQTKIYPLITYNIFNFFEVFWTVFR